MEKMLDVRGLKCPMPIVKAKKELDALGAGETLKVVATDKGSVLDFQGWVKRQQGVVLEQEETTDENGAHLYVHLLRKG